MTIPQSRQAGHILVGMVVGLVVGLLWQGLLWALPASEVGAWTTAGTWVATNLLDPVGQIFLRLLFLVVVPLVFASLVLGVSQQGRLDRLGGLAWRTMALFGLNMVISVALGLVMMHILAPGSAMDAGVRDGLRESQGQALAGIQATAASQQAGGFGLRTLLDLLLPRNVLKAVTDFQILPLIIAALLTGAAATTLAEDRRQRLEDGMETVNQLMARIVAWALALAPYAVALLVAATVMRFGAAYLTAVALFVVGVLGVIALHLFGTMSLLLLMFSRVRPVPFFKAIGTILVTAFSTSSSNATLPTCIKVTRERLGVTPSVASFVLPLGATMNMSGTALYEGCVVLFAAQAFGIDLTLAQQMVLLGLAVLSAVAVAGIPGGSLPLIIGLCTAVGVPGEGIALVLGVDRLLDMARTTLNVAADVVTAVIVDEATGGRPEAR
jgi:Na+/H+-dicarboxylate symporter